LGCAGRRVTIGGGVAVMPVRGQRKSGGILRRTADLLRAHDLFMMGAGIAFFFTLALVPLLLLGTSALGFALGSRHRAVAQIFPAIRAIAPGTTTAQLETFARSLVEGRGVAGWLGLLSLLWVSSGAYEAMANALTTLSGLRETRSFLRRKLLAAGLMLATGMLFLATLILASVATAIRSYGQMILEYLPSLFARAPAVIIFMAPPLLVGAIFLILYRWAPPQPIAWAPAVVGAVVAASLWYLAKRAFGWYLVRVARNHLLYGILGSFIGLFIWVYYTSLIFLLGAVVALACWRSRPAPGKS
jgi:membrane protein